MASAGVKRTRLKNCFNGFSLTQPHICVHLRPSAVKPSESKSQMNLSYRSEKIEARPSGIHGLGIFAVRDIACGEVLIEWDKCTEILTVHDVEKLSPDERKRVSFINEQYILFKPPACWV